MATVHEGNKLFDAQSVKGNIDNNNNVIRDAVNTGSQPSGSNALRSDIDGGDITINNTTIEQNGLLGNDNESYRIVVIGSQDIRFPVSDSGYIEDGTGENPLRPVVYDGDILYIYTIRGAVTSLIINTDNTYNKEVYPILYKLDESSILPHVSVTDLNVASGYRMVAINAVKHDDSIELWYVRNNGVSGNCDIYCAKIYPDGTCEREENNIDDGFYKVGEDGYFWKWDNDLKQYISTGKHTSIQYARELLDADDLFFKDSNDQGEEITIEDPGTTGTVLWGAESANQVALSVNGVSKLLLKKAAIDGVLSRIGLLEGGVQNINIRVANIEETAFDSQEMWELLTAGTSEQINISHIPDITVSKVTNIESWIASKGYITKSVNDLLNYYAKNQTYTKTEVDNLIGSLTQFEFRILPELPATGQSNVLYLIGPKGDTDVYDEYVYSNNTWTKIGSTSIDLSGYVQNTRIISVGDGLSGGGDLSADRIISLSQETIASLALADTALQSSDIDGYVNDIVTGQGNYISGVSKSGKVLTFTYGTLPTTIALSNVTGAEDLKAIETLSGTGFLKRIDDNSWALDTNTYALSGDLLAVSGRVTALESRINWDNYFGIDAQGNIYVRDIDENTHRVFYNNGDISAGGINSGGGGGGDIEEIIDRVWESLENNTDKPNVAINIAHIPSLDNYYTKAAANELFLLKSNFTKENIGLGKVGNLAPNEYFTALDNNGSNGVEITIGGVTKSLTINYASLAGNALTLDNHTSDYFATASGLAGVESSITSLQQWVQYWDDIFEIDEYGDVHVKHKTVDGSEVGRNLYTEGNVSAGGLTSKDSGGGIDLDRVWKSLTNNTDKPDIKINPAHIPDDDRLSYVDPDEGEEIIIEDDGRTGTVLWGAESANQVSLSVNGTSKLLLKAASLDGINSSITTLLGYFSSGSARNALALENHGASYFATASGLTALDTRVTALENDAFDPTEMWDLLGAATNEQINLSHIPDFTTAKISNLESWIASKAYITAAAIPTNVSAFTNDAGYLTQHQSLDAYVNAAGYNSTSKQIELKHGSTVVATIDATAFIKDGMVSNVTISGGYLVISFNTDSGKEDIRIPISDIFDASNYYTKSDADGLFFLIEDFTKDNIKSTLGIYDWALASTKPSYTKAEVGLGDVENVALSTWAGSTNITTLGTITAGTWNGNKITNGYLANNTIGVGNATISLGGSAGLSQIGVAQWAQTQDSTIDFSALPNLYIGTTGVRDFYETQELTGISTISASGLATITGGISFGGKYNEEDSKLVWDERNNAWHLIGNLYADGYITAGGLNSQGGGGGDIEEFLDRMWESLKNNTDFPDEKINIEHIPTIPYSKLSGAPTNVSYFTNDSGYITRLALNDYYTKGEADSLFLLQSSFTKANLGLENVDNIAASAYFTLLENDNNQISITVGGANKKLTVDYASQAGNASTLENHAASYFATVSALSGVSGRVTTLENRQNWDDIFELDANGDVHVKTKTVSGEQVGRNFYTDGNVSAGGLSSEGGGSSVDLPRVWKSLTNNTDFPDEKINLAHIPTIPYSNISGTPTIIDRARNLLDGDDLCYVDPEEGEEITIDDPGTTGTVLWGAESANQVSLSVNGVGKLLLKSAAIDGITSRLGILEGYFSNGIARNAQQLNGHSESYFATASSVTTEQIAENLTNAGYKLTDTIYTLPTASTDTLGGIKIGSGLAINNGVVSVTGQTQGTVTRVDVGSTHYNPNTNGIVSLPAYPTTLPASDVYAWAKASTLSVDSVPSLPWNKITSGVPTTLAGYGIADAKFSSAGVSDKIRITLGSNYHDVLTAHQSLSGYATESWVGQQGFITKAVNDLTNYYLKSDTYTKTEVEALIAAINQFHYEIAASTSAVTDPQSNVLYLIGPTGSGSDRYEEYVYTTTWVKIGDTSIDLSGYVNSVVASGSGNYISGFSKSGNTLTLNMATLPTTIALLNVTDADDLKAIEALPGTSGLLRKTRANAWELDTSAYITGIDAMMVNTALGYTPFNAEYFTKSNIKNTLGISDWALDSSLAFSSLPAMYIGNAAVQSSAQTEQDLGGIKYLTAQRVYLGDGVYFYYDSNNGGVKLEGAGFYTDSFVSAGGLNSNSGGGNIDLDRVWESLTNNTDKPNVEINVAHIPDITVSKVSNIESWISGKGYITASAIPTNVSDFNNDAGYLTDYTIYALTIKNSAGTNVLNYNPKTATGELSLTKAMVGLGNVENTALSTWQGSQNINTLGTITTGVWHGSAITQDYLDDIGWTLVRNATTYDTEDYIHVNS